MNSREDNLRFKIAFMGTNIRWLLANKPNHRLIAIYRKSIANAEKELAELKGTTAPSSA